MKVKVFLPLVFMCSIFTVQALEYAPEDIEQEMQEDALVANDDKESKGSIVDEGAKAAENFSSNTEFPPLEQELISQFKQIASVATGFSQALQSEDVKKLIEQERQRIEREQKSVGAGGSSYSGYSSRRRKRWW